MKVQNLDLKQCGADWDPLRKAICAGFYHQAAMRRGIGEYANLRTSVGVQLHPTSSLYGSGVLPEYVVYHELVLTSKEFMSCVTAVDPMWLADLGGVFYSIREKEYDAKNASVSERNWSRKEEIEAEMERDRQQEQGRLEAEERAELERLNKATKGIESVKMGGSIHAGKKIVSTGVVKKPVVKRHGRGI